MELVLKKGFAKRDFDLALPCVSVLPAVEAHRPHDLVDIVDHPLDHDRGVTVLRPLEEFSERGLAAVDLLLDRGFALEFDHVTVNCPIMGPGAAMVCEMCRGGPEPQLLGLEP